MKESGKGSSLRGVRLLVAGLQLSPVAMVSALVRAVGHVGAILALAVLPAARAERLG